MDQKKKQLWLECEPRGNNLNFDNRCWFFISKTHKGQKTANSSHASPTKGLGLDIYDRARTRTSFMKQLRTKKEVTNVAKAFAGDNIISYSI